MNEILNEFLEKAPIAVMVRATLVRIMAPPTLDGLFERSSEAQYTRELTFSTLIRLMTQVVFRTHPSVHAAYRESPQIPVSMTSVYNKLNGLEPAISRGLVVETAGGMREIISALPAPPAAPIGGLRLRTLDGNFLAGTDHRLACLRGSGAAAPPGMSLVVRDGRTGLLTDLIPCEDADTNERGLHAAVLSLVEPGDLWLADRNFCTEDYLGGIAGRGAFFLIRHHAGTELQPTGPETDHRERAGDTVCEQRVRVGSLECRCVIVRLAEPLRDGTTEIRLLTNVPRPLLDAARAADLYRTRWSIESAFQELTESLRCEIDTPGYPKAALFGFASAIVAYNLLVTTRAALSSGLGEEVGGVESLSSYHMAIQVAAVDEGMSIAVPPSAWEYFVEMTAREFAAWPDGVARGIDWRRYRKRPRGPKKPLVVKRTSRGAHRSTARELHKSLESAP
jgi:hypothetical protein